jgi:hypothetical protein
MLAALQKTNPGIIMSVKSQHAVRRILSILEMNARNMRRDGFLDEGEAEMITKVCFLEVFLQLFLSNILEIRSDGCRYSETFSFLKPRRGIIHLLFTIQA